MPKKPSPAAERMANPLYQTTETPRRQDSRESKPVKKTIYLRPEVDLMLTELQLKQHRETGERPDRSDLVAEAIELLYEQRQDDEAT